MAYLEFVRVGKIYAENENVSVGISDVSLAFEKGEIVAVTGKSGAGKSTFLRVAGGLETYEEGEMYIEGQPTSHYDDADRAQYLNKYISFVFQNYNILENFTVLENVEYALTQIKNQKERRKRAEEIVERVGLKGRMHFKGSRLSGGEKQRTVIARALAKDSPIILADEPTGNLDSKTAAEILSLLKEVSADKLLIIVTHNYDDVQHIATRHIRFYNGKAESDDGCVVSESSAKQDVYDFKEEHEYIFKTHERNKTSFSDFRANFLDAVSLGIKRVTSRPKQNAWIMGMFIVFGIFLLFTFASMDQTWPEALSRQQGRILVVQNSGELFSESQMQSLKQETSAQDGLLYDAKMDKWIYVDGDPGYRFNMNYRAGLSVAHGRQVQQTGEIVIRAPYTLSDRFSLGKQYQIGGMSFEIVGISYFMGNPFVQGEITAEDARLFTRMMSENAVVIGNAPGAIPSNYNLRINDSLHGNNVKLYQSLKAENYAEFYLGWTAPENKLSVNVQERILSDSTMIDKDNSFYMEISREFAEQIFLQPNGLFDRSEQISLYFGEAEEAERVVEQLNNDAQNRYVAYDMGKYNAPKAEFPIFEYIASAIMVVGFTAIAVFCLRKLTGAFRSDISVFRTMGISDGVVKGSTYVQLLLGCLPSVCVTLIVYFVLFMTPLGIWLSFVSGGKTAFLCILTASIAALVAVYYNRFLYRQKIEKGLRRSNK